MRSITLVAATSFLACLLISCAAISARKQDPHINLLSNPRFLVGLQTVYVLISILVSLRYFFIALNFKADKIVFRRTPPSGIANSSSIAGVFPGQPYSYMPPQPYSERQSAYPTPVPGSSGVPRFSSQLSSSERQSAYPDQSISAPSNDPGQPASATGPQVASLTVPDSLNQFVRGHLNPRYNPVLDDEAMRIQYFVFNPIHDFCELRAPICECKACSPTNSASASTASTASTQRECLKDIGLEKLPALVAPKLNPNVTSNSPEAAASVPSCYVRDLQACFEFLRKKALGTLEPELAYRLPAFIFYPGSDFYFSISNDTQFKDLNKSLIRLWKRMIRGKQGLSYKFNQQGHPVYTHSSDFNLKDQGWLKCVVYIDEYNHLRMLFIPVELHKNHVLRCVTEVTLVPIDENHMPSDDQKRDLVLNRFDRWCKLEFNIVNLQSIQKGIIRPSSILNGDLESGLAYSTPGPSYSELIKRYLDNYNINVSDLQYSFKSICPLRDFVSKYGLGASTIGSFEPLSSDDANINKIKKCVGCDPHRLIFGFYSPASSEYRSLNLNYNGPGIIIPQEFFYLDPKTLPPFLANLQQLLIQEKFEESGRGGDFDSSDPACRYMLCQAFTYSHHFGPMKRRLQLFSSGASIDPSLDQFKKNLQHYFMQRMLFDVNRRASTNIPVKTSLLGFTVPLDLYLHSENAKPDLFGDYHVVSGIGADQFNKAQPFYVLNGGKPGKPASRFSVKCIPGTLRTSQMVTLLAEPLKNLANHDPNPTVPTPWGQLTVNGCSYSRA